MQPWHLKNQRVKKMLAFALFRTIKIYPCVGMTIYFVIPANVKNLAGF